MISCLLSRLTILTFGTLYPAYYSFKTVRSKSVDEYMKWMTYWISLALFTAIETVTDIFLKWFPFYYEIKILLILWLLPTIGNGSPVIYRTCLNPFLKKHESRIDRALVQMKTQGQDIAFHYASEAIMYLGRGAMNIIHKNIPNGLVGLLANGHGEIVGRSSAPMRPVASSTMLIEELDDPQPSTSANGRKSTKRKTTKVVANDIHIEEEEHQQQRPRANSRGRSRKARQTKTESHLDINLNEH
ncbi:receptor expression-enhancing protein 1-like [Haematobia irritans]|uniref:receptor expression-enhancing protein 1-like n=1 Tax=Haematobia irritans TaxID=7368 RepID=UPI003F4F90B1